METPYSYILFIDDVESINVDEAVQYYVYSIYLKYLLKSYKKVKEQYFGKNIETTYIELEGLVKELKRIKIELDNSKSHIRSLNEVIATNERKIEKLSSELAVERLKNNELNSLREFMFTLDNEVDSTETIDADIDKLKDIKAVVVGGHERWQLKMKNYLHETIFLRPDMNNFDESILINCDVVLVYANYLNHKLYYKVMEYVRGKDIKICYIKQQNEKLALKEIVDKIAV